MITEVTDKGFYIAESNGLLRFTTDKALVESLRYFTPVECSHLRKSSDGGMGLFVLIF